MLARIRSRRAISRALTTTMAGGVAFQLTLLVSGVCLARALGPENRGYMALLTLVIAIAWQLGALGIPYALTYAIARAPSAARRIMVSLRGPIMIQAALAAIAAALVLGLLTVEKPRYVQIGAAMTVLVVVPTIYQRCGFGVLQGLRKFMSFNVFRVAPNATFAGIAAVLLAANVHDLIPYASAWALSQAIFAPFTMHAAKKAAASLDTGVGHQPPREAVLKFGRRSMFSGAPPVETYRLDQSIVALFLAPTALGYYVAALAFTNLPRFIAQSFGLVANPVVASRPTHEAAKRSMWRFFWLSVPFYLSLIVALWLAAPFLVRFFFGDAFSRAGGISRILLVATALFCARRVLADAARGAGYPGIGSIAEIAAFVSVFPLFAAFVPLWNIKGVAYALVVSSTIALAILVLGLLRAASTGRTPIGWSEIRAREGRPEGDALPPTQAPGPAFTSSQ